MNPRDRRALRAGAVLALVAFLMLRGVPWISRAEAALRERVAAKDADLNRMTLDLRALDSLERIAPGLRSSIADMAKLLVSGQTDTEATADVSARLGSLFGAEGAAVDFIQRSGDSIGVESLRRVVVDAQLMTDTPGLVAILGRLRDDSAAMSMERVRIVAVNELGNTPAESLRVNLSVAAWYLIGVAP